MASDSSSSPPPPSSALPLPLPPPPPTEDQSSPTTSNPSSSSKPKPTTASPPKKTQPVPWTHQETINLIQAYQDKWYSLKKGQLKASQWEEVAITVAARCGFDEPTKTATQCRHKIEKLRKRYRAERIKPYPNSWQYFQLMDGMERGPFPLAAQPMTGVSHPLHQQHQQHHLPTSSNYNILPVDESDSDENCSYGMDRKNNKSKSINHILRGEMGVHNSNNGSIYGRNVSKMLMMVGRGGNERGMRGMREASKNRKRKGYYENEDSEEEEEAVGMEDVEDKEEVRDGGMELAGEIRGFAERFMRVEKKKIEMMRETERYRMEMEKKRMEMILDSQRKIIDTISRAFGTHKKVKMGQEI